MKKAQTQTQPTTEQEVQVQPVQAQSQQTTHKLNNNTHTNNNSKHKPKQDFLISGTKFTVHKKYRLIRAIGHGAYGVVCSAQNTQTCELVAIKKITNLFNNPIETKRAIREVQLLRKLRHENILGLTDLMMNTERTDLYLVSELMDSDLHQIIVSKQPLSNDHIQYFIYQILRGLIFIHSANVIHRDLKPSNVLVNSNCDIKICDFGLARPVDATVEHKAFMTEYVATRWYRAPEIMLSWKEYSFAIDVWAVGCILAELLGRRPLFPGSDYMDQLKRTLKVIGKPDADDIAHIRSDRARAWITNFPATPRVNWFLLYPKTDPNGIDLLNRMLTFSPNKRINVSQAICHPYLEQLHDATDEPIAECQFDMAFEREFKDNTVDHQRILDVITRELQWFTEYQLQRTKYFKQINKNQNQSQSQSQIQGQQNQSQHNQQNQISQTHNNNQNNNNSNSNNRMHNQTQTTVAQAQPETQSINRQKCLPTPQNQNQQPSNPSNNITTTTNNNTNNMLSSIPKQK